MARIGPAATSVSALAGETSRKRASNQRMSADLRRGAEHLVGGGDHLGVQLIAALRLDQVGDLAHGIDGTVLKVPLPERSEPILAGLAHERRTGSAGFDKQV